MAGPFSVELRFWQPKSTLESRTSWDGTLWQLRPVPVRLEPQVQPTGHPVTVEAWHPIRIRGLESSNWRADSSQASWYPVAYSRWLVVIRLTSPQPIRQPEIEIGFRTWPDPPAGEWEWHQISQLESGIYGARTQVGSSPPNEWQLAIPAQWLMASHTDEPIHVLGWPWPARRTVL